MKKHMTGFNRHFLYEIMALKNFGPRIIFLIKQIKAITQGGYVGVYDVTLTSKES
jgi:hypothetical protein